MSGLFLVVLLLLGSFFSYSILLVKKDIEEPIKTIETKRVTEDERSYFDDEISSYFDMDDEN